MSSAVDPALKRAASRRRIRRLSVTLLTLCVLLAGGYTAAIALATAPAPEVELAADAEQESAADPASAQAIVDAHTLPTAVGWLHRDEIWSNSADTHPIASISKLVTALVCLEQQPLDPGAEGTVHVWTERDRALQEDYLARDGVAYPIPVGTEVTTRQMLTLMLLPSANDFASAYAYSVFGDNDAFIAAVDAWKAEHGIESLTLVEPSGMDEGNTATAEDVLRIGRLALANPTIAEFTRTPHAELPWGIGLVENTNPLLSRTPGMLGLKTGRSSVAGYNLVAAQQSSASGRELVGIAVTLSRGSAEERIQSTSAALAALAAAPQPVGLVAEGETVGTATTVDGEDIPLVTTASASAVLVPGESASRIAELKPLDAGKAGRVAGVIRVETPTGSEAVPVVTAEAIVEPGFWWRFTHPAAVLGGG